jgi:hypothetical protein
MWLLVKITITASLGLIAVRLTRRSRASVRHVVLTASFTMLLVLPAASFLAPPIKVGMTSLNSPCSALLKTSTHVFRAFGRTAH